MGEVRHRFVCGVTGTGKSWHMKRLAKALLRKKQQVIVYTGTGERDWPRGCHVTYSPDQLEEWLNNTALWGAHVFIDEAPILYKTTSAKTHITCWTVGQAGRHRGFTVTLGCQVPTKVPFEIRQQCAQVVSFRLGTRRAAETICEDWQLPDGTAKRLQRLPKLWGLKALSGGKPHLFRL